VRIVSPTLWRCDDEQEAQYAWQLILIPALARCCDGMETRRNNDDKAYASECDISIPFESTDASFPLPGHTLGQINTPKLLHCPFSILTQGATKHGIPRRPITQTAEPEASGTFEALMWWEFSPHSTEWFVGRRSSLHELPVLTEGAGNMVHSVNPRNPLLDSQHQISTCQYTRSKILQTFKLQQNPILSQVPLQEFRCTVRVLSTTR
jgi:hypothetical protein